MVLLFLSSVCEKCAVLKGFDLSGLEVRDIETDTDAMAEAAFYDVVDVPEIVIIDDDTLEVKQRVKNVKGFLETR